MDLTQPLTILGKRKKVLTSMAKLKRTKSFVSCITLLSNFGKRQIICFNYESQIIEYKDNLEFCIKQNITYYT
ncbi:unnamed protein product [Rhizophagus irregularis]|uniref:Uncharacterized protein n=1 Tax=Rhizophagus irregularis TaxID=588596 RepID=A0A915Z1D3_9GLOM|nr:unnamed protein product [Rhizophagus irregularis]CAB5203673.1 unnamed protein product [Rhizophagus irregularis]CAB5357183.1 unnamed protein product [Rhizophagus irregularis]